MATNDQSTTNSSPDSPTDSSSNSPKKSGLPAWAATILVLPIIAGGVWICYATWNGQSILTAQAKVMGPNNELQQALGRQREAEAALRESSRPDGISLNDRRGRGGFGGSFGSNNPEVKVGDTIIVVRRGQGANAANITFGARFTNADAVVPEADRTILQLRQRISEQATADFLGVTPEQREKYKDIGGGWNLNFNKEDTDALRTLFTAWESADAGGKPAAEQALLTKLREILPDRLAAHKAATKERADKLRAIFTPDQIDKFRNMGR